MGKHLKNDGKWQDSIVVEERANKNNFKILAARFSRDSTEIGLLDENIFTSLRVFEI